MKIPGSLLPTVLFVVLAGCASNQSPPTYTSPHFNRASIKRLAVVVPTGGGQGGYESIIESAFLKVLLPKGYEVVSRQSLDLIAKELIRTRDEAFDGTTASRIGKLANASHIAVVRMSALEGINTEYGNRYSTIVTAQIIDVETGGVAFVAEGKPGFFRVDSPAVLVANVAERAAQQIP